MHNYSYISKNIIIITNIYFTTDRKYINLKIGQSKSKNKILLIVSEN